jgi:hypothetical protein
MGSPIARIGGFNPDFCEVGCGVFFSRTGQSRRLIGDQPRTRCETRFQPADCKLEQTRWVKSTSPNDFMVVKMSQRQRRASVVALFVKGPRTKQSPGVSPASRRLPASLSCRMTALLAIGRTMLHEN